MKETYQDNTEWMIDPVEREAELEAVEAIEVEVEYQLSQGE